MTSFPTIPAEAHTDDRAFTVSFDALPYLEGADDATLAARDDADFAHAFADDDVARDMAAGHDELAETFVCFKQVNVSV